jgi:hypothetical protein
MIEKHYAGVIENWDGEQIRRSARSWPLGNTSVSGTPCRRIDVGAT